MRIFFGVVKVVVIEYDVRQESIGEKICYVPSSHPRAGWAGNLRFFEENTIFYRGNLQQLNLLSRVS